MSESDLNSHSRRIFALRGIARVAGFTGVIGLAALLTVVQMKYTNMLTEDRFNLDLHLTGTAHKPFAFRALIPQLVKSIVAALPFELANAAESALSPIAGQIIPKVEATVARPLHFYVLALLQFFFLLGYAVVGTRLYLKFWPNPPFRTILPVLLLALVVPFVAGGRGHVYDFSTLFLMASLFLALACDQYILYLALFAISCFNKETTLLATVLFGCYNFERMSRGKWVGLILFQGLISALVYWSLASRFALNPGTGMENYSRGQLRWLSSRTFTEYVAFGVVVLVVGWAWKEKPVFLKRSAGMITVNAGLCLCGAFPGELRNYYESLPILSLFVIRNIHVIVGMSNRMPSGPQL